MALDEDIHGKDPLDEAFEKHGITADVLVKDTWNIRNVLKDLASGIIAELLDSSGRIDPGSIKELMALRDKIEDTDREFRRLMGMYSKDNEQGKDTLTINLNMGDDD